MYDAGVMKSVVNDYNPWAFVGIRLDFYKIFRFMQVLVSDLIPSILKNFVKAYFYSLVLETKSQVLSSKPKLVFHVS